MGKDEPPKDRIQAGGISRLSAAFDRLSDETLHTFVAVAGSPYTFGSVLLLIAGWAIAGAFVAGSAIWQISMQNVSSIQCYLWDISLLYAQRRDNIELAKQISHLLVGGEQKLLVLRKLQKGELGLMRRSPSSTAIQVEPDGDDPQIGYKDLPQKSLYDVWADWVSQAAGSPWTQLAYTGGIAAWLAMGPSSGWKNDWQLIINTAVATELMLMTTFLQNTKRRHRLYMRQCSQKLGALDTEVAEQLLGQHGQVPEPNQDTTAQDQQGFLGWLAAKFGVHVCVDRYACFMSSLWGLLLSLALLCVWLGLGNVMGWGNANWWLIIGTYTGLVGFIDAFVLRNVMKRQTALLLARYSDLDKQDAEIGEVLHAGRISVTAPEMATQSAFHRVSFFFSCLVGHVAVTISSVVFVILLLIAATAMGWSETAQLLCNTPTMIIEGGMLLVLMMSHMASHRQMRGRLQALLQRRIAWQAALDTMAAQLPPALAAYKSLKMEEFGAGLL